jgi:hypothetical protein
VARFAGSCRLRLSDTARPENLHGGFWYDDGNEAWNVAVGGPLPKPPAGLPQDPDAVSEWNLVEARLLGTTNGFAPWRARTAAVAARCGVSHPGKRSGEAGTVVRDEADFFTVGTELASRGELSWLDAARASVFDLFRSVFAVLPFDAVVIEEAVRRAEHAARPHRQRRRIAGFRPSSRRLVWPCCGPAASSTCTGRP